MRDALPSVKTPYLGVVRIMVGGDSRCNPVGDYSSTRPPMSLRAKVWKTSRWSAIAPRCRSPFTGCIFSRRAPWTMAWIRESRPAPDHIQLTLRLRLAAAFAFAVTYSFFYAGHTCPQRRPLTAGLRGCIVHRAWRRCSRWTFAYYVCSACREHTLNAGLTFSRRAPTHPRLRSTGNDVPAWQPVARQVGAAR